MFWQPQTQHLPIPRATTAACDVIPPLSVTIASELTIPSISSGEVSSRTNTTASVFAASTASSAEKYILPTAAPGDAARPWVSSLAPFKLFSSNVACRSLLISSVPTLKIASSLLIIPSSTKDTATSTTALGVLLALRVWSIYNFPSSIVNSISCISL